MTATPSTASIATSDKAVKTCTKCGVIKPSTTEYFSASSVQGHKDGLYPSCRECKRNTNRLSERRHSDKARERQQRWRTANKDRARLWQANYLVSLRENDPERIREWKRRDRERHNWMGHPENAIADGKSSILCKQKGFSLVRILNRSVENGPNAAQFRAARLDVAINTHERVICHYSYIKGEDRWVCLPPPIAPQTEADRKLLARLMKHEEKATVYA